MKKIFLLLVSCSLAMYCHSVDKTNGQSSSEAQHSPAENELIRLIRENVQAMEDEDLEKAFLIANEHWSGLKGNKMFTQQIFDLYDLDYEIEEIDIIEQTEHEAQVLLVHVVKKVAGAEFRDQRTNTLLSFKKIHGAWKMTEREVKNIEYLKT